MELDDFKKIKTPSIEMEGKTKSIETSRIMDLIKMNFRKQKKTERLFSGFLILLTIIYLSLLRWGNDLSNTGLTLVALGCILGAVYKYFKSRLLSPTLFSLPLYEFLSEAEKRLQYMRPYDFTIIIPLLIMLGTGGGLLLLSRLLKYTDNIGLIILIWILFYNSLCVFGFWAGKKDWKKEHGALLDEIRKIKKQMDENKNE